VFFSRRTSPPNSWKTKYPSVIEDSTVRTRRGNNDFVAYRSSLGECSRGASHEVGRFIRSLTSGEYLPRFVMTPSSQEMESPAIPGQLTPVFEAIGFDKVECTESS